MSHEGQQFGEAKDVAELPQEEVSFPEINPEGVTFQEQAFDSYAETKEVLERLDFVALQNIFNELRSRSGIDAPADFIAHENVEVLSESSSYLRGEYVGGGKMMLNPFEIAKGEFEGDIPTSKAEMQRRILSILTHELTHGAGSNTESGVVIKGAKQLLSYFSKVPVQYSQSGFQSNEFQKGDSYSQFKFFNEGVTDTIGEKVYGEYLRRTGTAAEVSSSEGGGAYAEAYNGSRALVSAFVEMIAHSSGIPSDKVWEGVVSGYMNGIDLDSSELASSLNEVFYPEFMKQLKEAQINETEVPLPEVLRRVKEAGLPDDAQAKIKAAFEKFAVELETIAAQSTRNKEKLGGYIDGLR